MAVGLSFSDIVLSCQLAYTVYDRCFTKANGADLRYLEFGRQIKSLGGSLSTLEAVVANADKQNKLPRRPWHSEADRYGPSWDVLPDVAGDFRKTLEECDSLLADHSKFQYSQAGFIENVIWWSSVEGDVNALKERVRFHMMKLTFVAKPFEISLLLGIKRELELLRSDVQELKTILIDGIRHKDSSSSTYLQSLEVQPELANRFAQALEISKPPSFHSQADIPLKEGFEALVWHFANSTILFNPRPELGQRDPEEPQYLNLVKCRWIAQTIRQGRSFQSAGPDSLWADYMKELEDDIRGQFRRFDTGQLVRPPLNRISLLPESCFSIWFVEEPPTRPPDLAEQRPLEEKILELTLPGTCGTRKSSLTVFRKSESKMRLVTTTKDDQNQYFHHEKETHVNLEADRLIPTYASPGDASTATNNVMICTNEGQDPEWYSLKDADDVLHFQRALTGFFVSNQMLNISWSIEGSSKPSKSGSGRLQLWYLKPFQPIGEDGERVTGDQSSVASPKSPTPSAAITRQSTGFSASSTFLSAGSVTSTVNGPQGNGNAILRAEVPRIIIFTQCEGMYVLLQLKLHDSIFINAKKTKSPRTVVIDTHSRNIEFQKLYVKELYSWNLSCFRLPVHPEMRKLEKVSKGSEIASKMLETVKKKYLVLTFSTPADKETFCKEFADLVGLRDLHQNSYTKTLMIARHRANNPGSLGLPLSIRPVSGVGSFSGPSIRPKSISSSLGSFSGPSIRPKSISISLKSFSGPSTRQTSIISSLGSSQIPSERQSPSVTTSICAVLVPCLKSFNQLQQLVEQPNYSREAEVSSASWEDELGRLRVWAANIGAHQTGQSSLEFRLRDASHISKQITKLLRELEQTLHDIFDELSGDGAEALKDDEISVDATTELQQLHEEVVNIVDCLYQLSTLIRMPAQHDMLVGSRVGDMAQFEFYDNEHVRDLHPKIEEEIGQRLGRAITRRRKYLSYRERHHKKVRKGVEGVQGIQRATTGSVIPETIATEFKTTSTGFEETSSISGMSQTSYAPSLIHGGRVTIPPPPSRDSVGRKPFECPYCFCVIDIKSTRSWKRHVFKDIKPYMCTFPECSMPDRLYDSRREWNFHEMTEHRGDDLVCSLCKDTLESPKKYERHVARHLEEIALFVLPRTETDDVEEDDDDDVASSEGSSTESEEGELAAISDT